MRKFILTAIAVSAICLTANAQNKPLKSYGVVDLSANMMREEPDYAAELGDQALMGTVVELNGRDSYWLKITSPEPYTAWVNELGIVQMTEEEKDEYIAAAKYIYTAEHGHVYAEASEKSDRLTDIVAGCLVRQCYNEKGKVAKKAGFVKVMLPSGLEGYIKASDVDDFRKWIKSRRPDANHIISTAKLLVGVPYQWGGTSIKGVDCSGFARTVFFLNGILLPRNASQQAKVGDDVPLDQLQPGDLVFWGRRATADKPEKATHVAIYIGNNKIIQSSQKVRINDLDRSAKDGYDREAPLCARRILGNQDKNKGIISIAKSPWYFKQ